MKPSRSSTSLSWWLVDIASRLLERDERDAICGDLAESGETGAQALRGVLGFIVRRQLALWKDWHPWLALVGLVGIVGLILSKTFEGVGIMLFNLLYAYLRYGDHFGTGLTVGQDMVFLLGLALSLVAWSWVSGFVLGSLSGRASWLTGTLFILVVLNSRVANPGGRRFREPQSSLPWNILMRTFHVFPRAPWDFALFMVVWEFVLFVVPVCLGVYVGIRRRTFRLDQALVLFALMAVLTALVTRTSEWYGVGPRAWGALGFSWQTALLSWPLAYIVGIASWERWRSPTGTP